MSQVVYSAEKSVEYAKEIPVEEILAKIQKGEAIGYDNVTVKGDLNISRLDLPKRHIERTAYEVKFLGSSEDIIPIASVIRINNSTIEGCSNFNNTLFEKSVNFENTVFNGSVNFAGCKFNENATFHRSKFKESANFAGSDFNGTAGIWYMGTKIKFIFDESNGISYNDSSKMFGTEGARHSSILSDQRVSMFKKAKLNYSSKLDINSISETSQGFSRSETYQLANFKWSEFNRNSSYFLLNKFRTWEMGSQFIVPFWDSSQEFSLYFWQWSSQITADFGYSVFMGSTNFENSKFSKSANFGNSKFLGTAIFVNSNFNELANFGNSEFKGSARFGTTKFNSLADFSDSRFTGIFGDTIWDSMETGDFWRVEFNGPANFENSTFNGSAFFRQTHFREFADFANTTFNDLVYFENSDFGGAANFAYSKFNGINSLSKYGINGTGYIGFSNFNRPADIWFLDSLFSTYFRSCEFNGPISFAMSNFSSNSSFWNSKFNGSADFEGTKFQGLADFGDSQFCRDARFNEAEFEDIASFNSSQFKGDALFLNTTFSKILYLTRTKYDKFFVRWAYIERFGYDDTAYLLLMENFKKLGFFDDANDCYYAYRVEGRQYLSPPNQIIDLILWGLYGYGMKPLFPILLSAIIVLVFGFAIFVTNGIYKIRDRPENNRAFRKSQQNQSLSILEALNFSATAFAFGATANAYDSTEIKVSNATRYIITIERFLGWMLIALIIISLANTVIR